MEAPRREACIGGCFADDEFQFQVRAAVVLQPHTPIFIILVFQLCISVGNAQNPIPLLCLRSQEFLALLDMPAPCSSSIHMLPGSKASSSPDSTTLAMSPAAVSSDSEGSVDEAMTLLRATTSSPFSSDDNLAYSMDPARTVAVVGADGGAAANVAKMEAAINRMIREIGENPASLVSEPAVYTASTYVPGERGTGPDSLYQRLTSFACP